MSYVESRSDLLTARDGRQALIEEAAGRNVLVFLSLNIPGPEKVPPGAEALFLRGLASMPSALPENRELHRGRDCLGPFALLTSRREARQVKLAAITLEESTPWARLLDIDIYDRQGQPVSRNGLGFPPRACLACQEPARECILSGRHAPRELKARTDALLLPFSR